MLRQLARSIRMVAYAAVCLTAVAAVSACNPLYGFVESEFILSSSSRLPGWIQLPDGTGRDEVTVRMIFYTFGKVRISAYVDDELIQEDIGVKRWHPETEQRGFTIYPQYLFVTVRDKKELFANFARGPILEIVETPNRR